MDNRFKAKLISFDDCTLDISYDITDENGQVTAHTIFEDVSDCEVTIYRNEDVPVEVTLEGKVGAAPSDIYCLIENYYRDVEGFLDNLDPKIIRGFITDNFSFSDMVKWFEPSDNEILNNIDDVDVFIEEHMDIGRVFDIFDEDELLENIGIDSAKEYFKLFEEKEILIHNPFTE